LKLLNITADECLVFEDSPSGVKSAVDAKIKVVGVATSQSHEFLKSVGATIVVDHFDDLSIESLAQLVK
jgi:beta-phosphoglucomutase-like phosphatase (HAD superfamily)